MTDHNNKYMHLLLIFGNDSKKMTVFNEFVTNCIPRMPAAVHLRIYNSPVCS